MKGQSKTGGGTAKRRQSNSLSLPSVFVRFFLYPLRFASSPFVAPSFTLPLWGKTRGGTAKRKRCRTPSGGKEGKTSCGFRFAPDGATMGDSCPFVLPQRGNAKPEGVKDRARAEALWATANQRGNDAKLLTSVVPEGEQQQSCCPLRGAIAPRRGQRSENVTQLSYGCSFLFSYSRGIEWTNVFYERSLTVLS